MYVCLHVAFKDILGSKLIHTKLMSFPPSLKHIKVWYSNPLYTIFEHKLLPEVYLIANTMCSCICAVCVCVCVCVCVLALCSFVVTGG